MHSSYHPPFPPARRPRVLLADDHVSLHATLRETLEPEYDVVATVPDGQALVTSTIALRPDVVISDVSMPALNGFEAARHILHVLPRVIVIFLTVHRSAEMARQALALGARGYVSKAQAGQELPTAVADALAGKVYVSPGLH